MAFSEKGPVPESLCIKVLVPVRSCIIELDGASTIGWYFHRVEAEGMSTTHDSHAAGMILTQRSYAASSSGFHHPYTAHHLCDYRLW